MNSTERRIVLTTGGTGGHVFPALAVAECLRELAPGVSLLFVGSEYGPEKDMAARAGVEFHGLPVRGVLGRGTKAVAALAGMTGAVFSARRLLGTFRPHVVAGFGAYASVPSLVAAKTLGIPVAVHEQNAVPGVSNRLLGKLAARVFLSLPDTQHRFNAQKCVLTGNPVRGAIAELMNRPFTPVAGRKPRLLVMGGSQGAKAINSVVLAGLNRLTDVDIRHQTGQQDFERVRAGYQAHGRPIDGGEVSPFITDMTAAYTWADFVLCRSGASTVAELALTGKPALFIPFPFATHDHQTANARAMAEAGAAVLVSEADYARVNVTGMLREHLFNDTLLERMSLAARTCARPEAARNVAKGILQLAAYEK